MKKAKQFLALILAILMIGSLIAGCGKGSNTADSDTQTTEAPVLMDTQEGKIEGEQATGMVDKLVTTLSTSSFDTSPFAPPTMGMIMKPMMYATLIYRTYYGAPLEDCTMWLARSVTEVDALTYDIELYDYITDSKGNHIDADDVIFSYEMSKSLGQFLNVGTNMESLTKTGDYSLRMVINKTAPGVLEDLLSNTQLYIVDKEWYESASDDERRNDPAVTGAYQVASMVSGSSVVLEAVENYWQTDVSLRPSAAYQNVKTVEFKVITEASMRAIAQENNEVDITTVNNSDLAHFFENGQAKDGYNVAIAGGTSGTHLFLNMDSGKSVLADNVDLRRAVLYAISSEDVMYATGADEYTGLVSRTLGTRNQAGYLERWDNEDYFDYNPEKAAEYLTAAGYKPGEVTLRVMTSSMLFNDSVRAVLIANLEEAGFKVDSLAVDQALFNTYKNDSTQWDIMIDLKGGQTGHIIGCWDYCFNPSGYVNGSVCFTHDDTLTQLLDEANNKGDEASMIAFHNYLKEQAICKGLYASLSSTVSTDGILEITMNSMGSTFLPNALVFASDYKSVG